MVGSGNMWFNSIQQYKNYTILFNGGIIDRGNRGGAIIWHENGKTLLFDSYSYSGPFPAVIDKYYRCHVRFDDFVDYHLNKKYKIVTITNSGYLRDSQCDGHPADEVTLIELGSSDDAFINNDRIQPIYDNNSYGNCK